MTPATINKDWLGETVAIFASGPSMSVEIAESLRGQCRVIAINNQSFDCAPWADVIWASDHKWWKQYYQTVKDLPGRKLMVRRGLIFPGVEFLDYSQRVHDERASFISCGGNSGYAAISLAAKYGAARVLLYGFDMRPIGNRFRRHDYPANLNSRPRFKHWIPKFVLLADELKRLGTDVVNCTPGSALKCFRFERVDLRRAS